MFDPVIQKKESLGEVLNGDCLANALYELQFWKDKTDETLCEKKLQGHEVAKFREDSMYLLAEAFIDVESLVKHSRAADHCR
ncbi:transmembrane 9 superfamily member 5 [Tripterygium wilfordii]|uniref:Transmembrane 9 superfamily member 5 n=1 Tax=Tripterygium wilfordii TaxID=458696 RepID=A0A7J7DET5_TRIWF|nr:transmembrane 9 superfamily member 5 [Tripterygium wilfordii]